MIKNKDKININELGEENFTRGAHSLEDLDKNKSSENSNE